MRYCLACRNLSGEGAYCTRCGRSFGGRLCGGKQRHLNPPDALYCGQCGSQDLSDAADSIPLGSPLKLLVLLGFTLIVVLGVSALLGSRLPGFTELTGYRSPAVWLIETSARPVIFAVVIYVLLGLLPGKVGRQLQKLFGKFCVECLRFAVTLVLRMLTAILRVFGGNGVKR
jgi:hypothetical protein